MSDILKVSEEEARKSRAFFSTKRFGPISTGHRQWRAKNHCSFVHGYGRIVEITFGAYELDDKGWVQDFGALRCIKQLLESAWDHRTLIAHDDPALEELKKLDKLGIINLNVVPKPYGPGIEQSAHWVFDIVNAEIISQSKGRVFVEKVQIWEHENNSAIHQRTYVRMTSPARETI